MRRSPRGGPARRPKERARADVAPTPIVPYSALIATLRRSADPVTVPGLARRMSLDLDGEEPLRRQLEYLERQGIVFAQRRGRWSLHSRARIVIGRVTSPEGRYGFVAPEEGSRRDLYVAGRRMAGARHGDLVLARIIRSTEREARDSRGSEGEVIAVLERRPPFTAGIFRQQGTGGIVTPRDDRIAGAIVVGSGPRDGAEAPPDGSVVWVEITSPGDRFRPALGRVAEVLGRPDEARTAEAAVIRSLDLPGPFPPEVESEAGARADRIGAEERAGREDFTGTAVVTVDPADARDHDDAVGLTRVETARGSVHRLSVHIADVAHYVPAGGAVDGEAFARGTSIYLPGRCIPMLPEALSSGMCSLLPGVDRLVQTVVIDFDTQGKRVGYRFADGVIRSGARLSYEDLQAILDGAPGAGGSPHAEMLREMDRLRLLLRTRRMRRGSLDLEIPETIVMLDDAGRPAEVRPAWHGTAHEVIEEFMLAANETVAEHLRGSVPSSIYRIHEDPDPEVIDETEEALAKAGLAVRRTRGAPAARLAGLLAPFRGRPEEPAVAMMILRSLKLARYSHEAIGHFGLAAPLYTHFTSPIRRYPDLVVHRILRAARSGAPPEETEAGRLESIALQCSRLERRAEEAERSVRGWLIAIHMSGRVGESFHGVVTGVTSGAVFVTLEGLGVDGIVPIDGGEGAPGRRSGRRPSPWSLGETLRVRVQAVDTFRARILLKPLSAG